MQVKRVRCEASGVLVAKDKAIKRFIVRNIVDASAIRDIQDSSILEGNAARHDKAHQQMLSTITATHLTWWQNKAFRDTSSCQQPLSIMSLQSLLLRYAHQ